MIRRREPRGLHDRARGAMLGLAVGDALGAAVEWLHPDQITSRYGGPLRDMVASGMWALGEWTDDTAMAVELAASMADQGRYDEDDVFGRYALWARSRPKDIGATVAAALRRSRSPAEARAAAAAHHAAEGRSAGNGSLMRTVPIAIRYRRDPGAIERISRLDSALTHHDPLAGDACAWFNLTVAALIQGRPPPRSTSDIARIAEEAVAVGQAELAAAAQEQRGYVLTTLRIAFAAAFRHDAFEPAVVFAVNLGGDADTNAAVTGALAGARFGADAIPQRWVEPLLRKEVVTGLANRLTRP
ncbi:MAG TPA: ADP-ribosylglycohydrolase family protein [Gaiellales bacterium]|nr:ADP-ribosylglycohydrolase family protein [Gaiellales bacterium]